MITAHPESVHHSHKPVARSPISWLRDLTLRTKVVLLVSLMLIPIAFSSTIAVRDGFRSVSQTKAEHAGLVLLTALNQALSEFSQYRDLTILAASGNSAAIAALPNQWQRIVNATRPLDELAIRLHADREVLASLDALHDRMRDLAIAPRADTTEQALIQHFLLMNAGFAFRDAILHSVPLARDPDPTAAELTMAATVFTPYVIDGIGIACAILSSRIGSPVLSNSDRAALRRYTARAVHSHSQVLLNLRYATTRDPDLAHRLQALIQTSVATTSAFLSHVNVADDQPMATPKVLRDAGHAASAANSQLQEAILGEFDAIIEARLAHANAQLLFVSVVPSLILAAALFFAWLLTSGIRQNYQRVTDALQAMILGDFDRDVRWHSNEEFGAISRALENVRQTFLITLQTIERQRAQLQSEIKERREAEQAVLRVEASSRDILHTMLDGLIVCDALGTIVDSNPAAEQIFCYGRGELVGRPVLNLVRSERRAILEPYISGEEAPEHDICKRIIQTKAQRRSGEIFPIELVLNRVTTDIGMLYFAIVRDLSGQLQMEQELRRMAAAVEAAADAIAIYSIDGRIAYVNAACERMTGKPRTRIIGNLPMVLGLGMDNTQFVEDLRLKIVAGEVWTGLIRRRCANGTVGKVDCSIAPLRDQDGAISHAVCVMRDVTAQKQLEDQLARAQKLEAIGQLAAGIAHEINTPTQYVSDNIHFVRESFSDLDSLLGSVQQLADSPGPAAAQVRQALAGVDFDFLRKEIPKALEQSADGCQRIATIVRAMKEFSHPARDKTPVDLNHAIQSTITVATNEWKYVAEIAADLDPDLPYVSCVPGEINQVILNMLVNAAHAISDVVGDGGKGKGVIRVSTRRAGDFAEIRIRDTGTGISPEVRRKIFDPFFTTKPVGRGTGQGLAIAHDVIVNRHGGSIALDSTPGQGSTFIRPAPRFSTDSGWSPRLKILPARAAGDTPRRTPPG